MDYNKIGPFLKDLRLSKNMSQYDLAERMHVDHSKINRLENMADEIRDEAISRILNDDKANPILVIKQKELFEEAEKVTDMCEHVANVVESIIVKNN